MPINEERLRRYCADLRQRVCAGEPYRAEEVFRQAPELNADPETAIDLIYTEFLARCETGDSPAPAEYYERFPHLRKALYHQFQIHDLLHEEFVSQVPSSQDSVHSSRPAPAGLWTRNPNGFEVLGEIARGSVGIVYQAWQQALQRLVALKIVVSPALSTSNDLARFRVEAAALARLNHPNIIQVFG